MDEPTVRCFVSRRLQSNCYVLTSSDTCVVIDPGEVTEDLLTYLNGRDVDYILLTHGHYDHIAGVKNLKRFTDAQVGIHRIEARWLLDPVLNRSSNTFKDIYCDWPDILFEGDEVVQCASISIKILFTPGHSPGSISYLIENKFVFTGDTLFSGFVGPTHLPQSNRKMLKNSIQKKLYTLPNDVIVYPGHGKKTTIKFEKRNNTIPNAQKFFIN